MAFLIWMRGQLAVSNFRCRVCQGVWNSADFIASPVGRLKERWKPELRRR